MSLTKLIIYANYFPDLCFCYFLTQNGSSCLDLHTYQIKVFFFDLAEAGVRGNLSGCVVTACRVALWESSGWGVSVCSSVAALCNIDVADSAIIQLTCDLT